MANFRIQNVRIQLKNDTAANWDKSSLILMAGEMAIETDTKKFKIGDGTKTFKQLPYADADGIAASVEGDAGKGKVIKTNNEGLLDDSFLKAITVDQTTDNTATATSVLTSADIDGKGRTSTTTKMGIAAAGGTNSIKKLVQADSSGELADSFLKNAGAAGDFTVANITVDVKGRVTAASSTSVTDAGGSGNNAKLVKTDDLGELADSFLKNQLAASDDTGDTVGRRAGNYTMANVTVDEKGRVTAISSSTPADLPIATDTTLGAVKAGAANNATDAAKIDKVLVDTNGVMSVAEVTKATQLSTARTISASGDATGSVSFDGHANVDMALTLANSGVTAGAYSVANVTVDSKGRVTAISAEPTTVTGGTAADKNKLVRLGANGKLSDSVIPPLAIGEVYGPVNTLADVATEAGSVPVQTGDMAIVQAVKGGTETDKEFATRQLNDGLYIYKGDDGTYSTDNFAAVKTPGESVQSVNGKTGRVVTLGTDDVAEGSTNLYYTSPRAELDASRVIANGSYLIDCGDSGPNENRAGNYVDRSNSDITTSMQFFAANTPSVYTPV